MSPAAVWLSPTTCPRLLIAKAVDDSPPSVPRSYMPPPCQRTAWNDPDAVRLAPTICPRSLMPLAAVFVPPRSVMTPSSQRKACVSPVAVSLDPTTCARLLIAVAIPNVPPSEPRYDIAPWVQRIGRTPLRLRNACPDDLTVVVDGDGRADRVAIERAEVVHDPFLPEEGVSVASRRLGFPDDLSPGVDADRGAAFSAESAELDYRSVCAV